MSPISSWLLRFWRGEVGFGKSFLIFFFAVFFAPLVAALVVIQFVPARNLESGVLLTVVVACVIVPTVGFWRSAKNQKWGWLLAGRFFIVIWLWQTFSYVTGIRNVDDVIALANYWFI